MPDKKWRVCQKINPDSFFRNLPAIIAFPFHKYFQSNLDDVLFITGSDSNNIVPDHELAVTALFPKAKIKEIPETGYWLHVQNPELFLSTAVDYLGLTIRQAFTL